MKEKLNKIYSNILRYYYQKRFRLKFEKGFTYMQIKHSDLNLLEKHHRLLLKMEWKQYDNVTYFLNYAYCWYRKKLQT